VPGEWRDDVNPPERARRVGLALGGDARAGLEDTLYLCKGEIVRGNTPLAQSTADLARSLDLASASVNRTEKILSLPSR
jgi:uncharacterized protein (DUF849 family)